MDPGSFAELLGLLHLPRNADDKDISRAYRKVALQMHPDKGGNADKMKRLNALMEQYRSSGGSSGPDLTCTESPLNSEDEDPDEGPSGSAGSAGYFSQSMPRSPPDPDRTPPNSGDSWGTPPKFGRTVVLPEVIEACLLNEKSVQSCPDVHLVCTTQQKMESLRVRILQHFTTKGYLRANWGEDLAFLLLHLQNTTRVSTIQNFLKKHCTISYFNSRGVKKNCFSKLCAAFKDLDSISIVESNLAEEGPEEKQFNYALLNEFAITKELTDALLLLAVYKRFATPIKECLECKGSRKPKGNPRNSHPTLHDDHHKNAKIFTTLKDQKRICQCAVDCVLAERRYKAYTMTRNEMFAERVGVVLKGLARMLADTEETDNLVCAMLLLNMLIKGNVELLADIIETMVRNPPKQRYFVFKGPVNTGKTTLAAGLLNLLGGSTLNVNGNPERLPFELGCAIDCFAVLFEDVKGQPEGDKSLPSGMGMLNLDNLRDHLDGYVPVNLERKHQNKVSQIFPPGIITCNQYVIPHTVRVRCRQVVDFAPNPEYARALDANLDITEGRYLTKAETVLGLLLVTPETEGRVKKTLILEHKLTVEALKLEFDRRCMKYSYNLREGKAYFAPDEEDSTTW
uniref:Large T antigen n=1 Tax=Serinus canaria polyomavirus TaxID=2070023 RepID=A0A2I6RKC2_9POLY|nr:putative large T antigen [Serinus canaria polyomavirus]AUN86688.1 putative large T antigen [Serinus canaria polyomavirus]AUN86703.1 putative large T antigen [Serinus canaria polyomavirus]